MIQSVFFSIFVLLNALTLIIIFWGQISQTLKTFKTKLQIFKSKDTNSESVINLNGFQRASRGLPPLTKRPIQLQKAVVSISESLNIKHNEVSSLASKYRPSKNVVQVAKRAVLILLGLSEAQKLTSDCLISNQLYNLTPEDLGLLELETEQNQNSSKLNQFKGIDLKEGSLNLLTNRDFTISDISTIENHLNEGKGGVHIKYRSRRGRKIANNFYRQRVKSIRSNKRGDTPLSIEAKIIRKLRKIDRHIDRKRKVTSSLLVIPEFDLLLEDSIYDSYDQFIGRSTQFQI